MTNYRQIFALPLLLLLLFNTAEAKNFRVNQIPNGTKFSCANCHVSPNGGGKLTDFGETIESKYLKNGNVVWNAELAALDSDNDGFSNGEELQDKNGSWTSGSSAPGVFALVTNPGNILSKPEPSFIKENSITGVSFSAFPNPFSESLNIALNIESPEAVKLQIFSVDGSLITTIYENIMPAGAADFSWDGVNNAGKAVSNGVYLLKIRVGNENISKLIRLER